MTVFYDRFSALCEKYEETPNSFAKKNGIPSGSITAWKKGSMPRPATLDKIASSFGVTVGYLLGTEEESQITKCEECGFQFDASNYDDVKAHNRRHSEWAKAVEKFGFWWEPAYREYVKGNARAKIDSGNIPNDVYMDAQENIFKALFSRSVEACGFDLRHVSFPEYVAMLLNQEHWKKDLNPFIYNNLVEKYGTRPGIAAGTYYTIPVEQKKAPTQEGERAITDADIMFALWGDTTDVDEDDLDDVRRYAAFIRERKKKHDPPSGSVPDGKPGKH